MRGAALLLVAGLATLVASQRLREEPASDPALAGGDFGPELIAPRFEPPPPPAPPPQPAPPAPPPPAPAPPPPRPPAALPAPPPSRAAALVDIRGSADASDAAIIIRELDRLPAPILDLLARRKTRVAVCRSSITDYRTDLKGRAPRGWDAGATWDALTGRYDLKTNEVIIAVIGHGTPEGPHMGRYGERSGSVHEFFHETGHALDRISKTEWVSDSPDFIAARDADLGALTDYEKQPGQAGRQETFAESFAASRVDEGFAKTHPNLARYWSTDPLGRSR